MGNIIADTAKVGALPCNNCANTQTRRAALPFYKRHTPQHLPCFHRQVVLRGVGHAALHNPGEVNLCALLKDSVIYDDHFRDRIVSSKEAKKASKRWHKVENVPRGDLTGSEHSRNGRRSS